MKERDRYGMPEANRRCRPAHWTPSLPRGCHRNSLFWIPHLFQTCQCKPSLCAILSCVIPMSVMNRQCGFYWQFIMNIPRVCNLRNTVPWLRLSDTPEPWVQSFVTLCEIRSIWSSISGDFSKFLLFSPVAYSTIIAPYPQIYYRPDHSAH
jgi:hypothetical protein